VEEYKPKRVGRPVKRKGRRTKRRKKKYPGPGSALRKNQYKVLNLRPLTYQMVKELAMYYKTSMLDIVHRMIEAAFNKTLIEVERKDKEERWAEEQYRAAVAARRKERENAASNQPKP
jgi:2-phospho-L-lactate transferase/gluconeogenesis factor (CofD/UPF0052 family)